MSLWAILIQATIVVNVEKIKCYSSGRNLVIMTHSERHTFILKGTLLFA